jgi:hypothetical protein
LKNSYRSITQHLIGIAVSATVSCAVAAPSAVQYAAVDLPDTVVGKDLWRYDYTILGSLGSFESVNLLFSYSKYAAIDLLAVDASAFSAVLTQPDPDPLLLLDGQLTATALRPLGAASTSKVSVSFIWLAGGAPAAQSFEYLDDAFNVVSTGTTTPAPTTSPVPEPAAVWSMLAGLALIARSVAMRRSKL